MVTLTVTDADALSSQCSSQVVVEDCTDPVVTSCDSDKLGIEPTGTGGAIAVFTTPTSDDSCDGVLPVTCTAPSGSVFPIGTNTVTCSATDAALNVGSCTLTVEVLSPAEVVLLLETRVQDLVLTSNLTQGQANGLLAKLARITEKIGDGKIRPTCNQIGAFINQLNGLENGGHLTPAEAPALINSAINAGNGHGCDMKPPVDDVNEKSAGQVAPNDTAQFQPSTCGIIGIGSAGVLVMVLGLAKIRQRVMISRPKRK